MITPMPDDEEMQEDPELSHDVPADLLELHEVIEWEAAQSQGPNDE